MPWCRCHSLRRRGPGRLGLQHFGLKAFGVFADTLPHCEGFPRRAVVSASSLLARA